MQRVRVVETLLGGPIGFILASVEKEGIPTPRVFLAKSSELHENKRVELLIGAKNDKRLCIRMKTKEMNRATVGLE
jgi:hypothetical protein